MNVLVACEESQRVCTAFRERGHNAFSCDIEPCSGGHPEWHIKDDVLHLLNGSGENAGKVFFVTQDLFPHSLPKRWDMIIAFPPCTHLAVSGAAWFEKKRADGRQREAIEFFMQIMNADCDKIAVENPVNIISGDYIGKHFADLQDKHNFPIKPAQAVQPYEFGDEARKKTCLWLKGLPKLVPTNIVSPGELAVFSGKTYSVGASADMARDENGKIIPWNDPRTAKSEAKHSLESQKQWLTNGGNTMNTPYQDQNNDLINRRFDEQNKILEEQNVMLARLLELLEVKE